MSWFHIDDYVKDGTLVLLVVDYKADKFGDIIEAHPIEDVECFGRTIGWNNFLNDGDDEWIIFGWDWTQDCVCLSRGKPTKFRPFPTNNCFDPIERELQITKEELRRTDWACVLWVILSFAVGVAITAAYLVR